MRIVPVVAVLVSLALQAQETPGPPPVIRVKFQPATAVMVGEAVRLSVQVLVPSFFMSAPQFPRLEIPSAMVVSTEDRPLHLTENIGGTSYAGVSQDYLIYPQSPSDFTLPPAEVTFTYSLSGATASDEIRLKLPPEKFTATIPPEAEGMDYFIATPALTLSQSFDRTLTGLKEGDSIHRAIAIKATRTFAMFLPPISFTSAEGLAVYPAQPRIEDQRDSQGNFVAGSRIESVTYLITKQGDYRLPEVTVSWWDLTSKQMKTTRLKAIEFSAASNPDYRPELAPVKQPEQPERVPLWTRIKPWVAPTAIAILAVGVTIWLIRRYGSSIRSAWASSRRKREESESAQFERFIKAAQHYDAQGTMRELLRWADSVKRAEGKSLANIRASAGSQGFDQDVARLEAHLYSSATANAWSGRSLAHSAREARKVFLQSAHGGKVRTEILPPLNP